MGDVSIFVIHPHDPPSLPPSLRTCVSDKASVDEAVVVVHALREIDFVQHGGGLLDDHLLFLER